MNSYYHHKKNHNNRYCLGLLLILVINVLLVNVRWRIVSLLSGVSGFTINTSRRTLTTTNYRQLQQQCPLQQQQDLRRNNKLFQLYEVLSPANENFDNRNNLDDDDEYPIEQSDSLNINNNNDDTIGGSHIPQDGYSVSDAITDSQKDRFVTTVVPIQGLHGVAQLVTSSTYYQETFEPVRYLVSLVPPPTVSSESTSESLSSESLSSESTLTKQYYVLVDVPPYSTRLVQDIAEFIGTDGVIVAMIITNKDSIHYDDATGNVFSIRQNDISAWKKQYPTMSIIGYRLDIPRNCRSIITQILDGYGPFAADVQSLQSTTTNNKPFIETGRPLTYQEWDTTIANDILSGNKSPDYDSNDDDTKKATTTEEDVYTPEAIRQREIGKHIIAVYTPGHTFGSVSYVFPYQGICCSGYVLPIEDNRVDYDDDNNDNDIDRARISSQGMGPILDCRGYITTNQVGIIRQMETARNLIHNYIDRFHIILPARGDPLFLEKNSNDDEDDTKSDVVARRKATILQILSQYEKIGTIYEQLGIVSSSSSME